MSLLGRGSAGILEFHLEKRLRPMVVAEYYAETIEFSTAP